VAQRRHVLDLAVLFYTHLAEVTAWLESLRRHLLEDLNFSTGTPSLEDTQVNKVVIVMKLDTHPMRFAEQLNDFEMNAFPHRKKKEFLDSGCSSNLSVPELIISFAEYPGANGFTQRLNDGRMLEHTS